MTSSKVYPSKYAYRNDIASRKERESANCKMYNRSGAAAGVFTENFIKCTGTQLILTDDDVGSHQYEAAKCYTWNSGTRRSQLLFTFPARVNLATITLHYYSGSGRGLSRLSFYAVPDDFDVWDALSTNYRVAKVAAVSPDGEPAGRRNISIAANLYTLKVLLSKIGSSYEFAMSEVEFYEYSGKLKKV